MNLSTKLYSCVTRDNRVVILDMVERDENATILDCGCGSGDFTKEIAAKSGTDKVYGVEFIEYLARSAEGKGISIYHADLNKGLPIKDESFDFVCANQIIEHLSGTDVFIKEIYRVLKQGGYAIISTNNLASFHNIVSLLLGKQPFPSHISNEVIVGLLLKSWCIEHKNKGGTHLRIFAYAGLKELFEYHKFKVEKIVGVGYYPLTGKLGRFLSQLDKRHSVYLTMKVRKG